MTDKCVNVSPLLNTCFSFLFFSSISNSFYLSTFMQKWKIARGELSSSNRLLLRRSWMEVYPLRWWVKLPKGNRPKKLTILLKSLRWSWGQLLARPLLPSSCPPSLVRGKGKTWGQVRIPSPRNPPVLLHEDSQYAFKQIFSIIKDEDYEDLGNHATEAMGRRAYSVWYRYVYPSPYLCSILFFPS